VTAHLTRCHDILTDVYESTRNMAKIMIDQLSVHFQSYFQRFGLDGMLSLGNACDESNPNMNPKLWCLNMRVMVDPTIGLVDFSSMGNSGGERSLTTLILVMSMQRMIPKSPICVMDEINQGMDPVNEGRVYEVLSSVALATCDGNNVASSSSSLPPPPPQCIILTPQVHKETLPSSSEGIFSLVSIFNDRHVSCRRGQTCTQTCMTFDKCTNDLIIRVFNVQLVVGSRFSSSEFYWDKKTKKYMLKANFA